MPTTVKIRRSGTASATPSALEHGEIAINYADGKVFWKNASNVITSFTFQSYALVSHTHAASDITSGTLDIARIPTGSTSSTVCLGSDARLSDTRTPTDNTVSTAKIQNDAVTYAKIQNVSATDRLLGRSSSGAGDVEEITCTSFGRSLIDDADAAAARTTLSVQPTAGPVFTSGITVTQASAAPTVVLRNTTADATDKAAQVVGAHYTATEETIQGIGIYSTATENVVAIGGGSALSNAASEVRLYTAANTTTTTGTIRLTISSTGAATFAGQVRVNTADSSTALLVNGATKGVRFNTSTDGTRIEGVDNTGVGSYQPLILNGSTVTIQSNGGTSAITVGTSQTATFAGQIVGQAGAAISGGAVTVTSPLRLTGTVAGNNRMLEWQTSGTTRWQVSAHFNAESGSNAGSDLHFTRWSDAGVFLGTPLQIRRDNGIVTVESGFTAQGQVLVTAGSGSAGSYKPGLAISGDDDTGVMQVGGANTLSVVTGGSERLRVDASGNVGIGIAPSTQLHVGSLGVFRLQTGSVTMDCTPTAGALDGFVWNTNPASYYQWNTGGTQRLLIGSDGKITCKGLYDNTVGATNRDVFVDSGGVVGYVSSIRESKTDIVTLDDVSWLSALSPVSYRYRKKNSDGTYSDEADGVTDYGLIAEDVEAVRPELCFYDQVDGDPQLRGVTYSKLITPMLRYIQQLEQRIAALEERLNG